MSVLTKKQVLMEFAASEENDLFCCFCYETLKRIEGIRGNVLYCPNEMCYNDKNYNLKGQEVTR